MLRLPNEVALKFTCPVYEAMALAPKASNMRELQDAIDAEIATCKKKHIAVVLIYSSRNLKVSIMGPIRTVGFSILPVTKIAPQATRLHEPSTGNCGYS